MYAQPQPPTSGQTKVPFFQGELLEEGNTTTWDFTGTWSSTKTPVPGPTNADWSFKGELESGKRQLVDPQTGVSAGMS